MKSIIFLCALFCCFFDLTFAFAITAETTPCVLASSWPRLMIHADPASSAAGEGAGIKIAVVDSGIDTRSPAFRNVTIIGRDFAGGNDSAPYPYFDNEGHGSHVAGLIAGLDCSGKAIGLAPKATLYVARACGDKGCRSKDIGAAIEWAISQKVDVINMSIEGDVLHTSQRELEAVRKAIASGISVVTISGNGGEIGSDNTVAEIEGVIVAGAVNKWMEKPFFSQTSLQTLAAPGVNILSASLKGKGYVPRLKVALVDDSYEPEVVHLLGTPLPPETGLQATSLFVGFGGEADFASVDATGQIVIAEQGGGIGIDDKIGTATKHGAIALIILLDHPYFATGLATSQDTRIPVFFAAKDERDKMLSLSRLSERVLLTASRGDYILESGTSMAAPFVAGAVALIRSVNRKLNPMQIKNLLIRSAAKTYPNRPPTEDNPFGAGILDIEKALEKAR